MRTLLAACLILFAGIASAQDKYAGYYYPEVGSEEEFGRVITDAVRG